MPKKFKKHMIKVSNGDVLVKESEDHFANWKTLATFNFIRGVQDQQEAAQTYADLITEA